MPMIRVHPPNARPIEPMPPLSHADRRVLDNLFSLPLSQDVSWHGVVGLCEALGGVEVRPNGKFAFQLRDEQHVMVRPEGDRLAPEDVMDFRELITRAGYAPELSSPPATTPGAAVARLLIVVDHHEAKLYRIDLALQGAATHVITPYDPHQFLHHLAHKDQSRERGQRAHEDATFYERIAEAASAGGQVVLIGDGAGHSSAVHHLAEYLRTHHPETYQRIILERVADLGHLTDAQLLAIGRKAFA